jgi:HNH endonuclease
VRKKRLPLRERFSSHVQTGEACWLWTGPLNDDGYGVFHVFGKNRKAHRVAYELSIADPGDMCVLHRCDNPRCVRPDHLFLGTHADNMRDCAEKGRATRKLSPEQVLAIRAGAAAGASQHRLGCEFGISQSMVGRILNGKNWGHL